MTAFEFAKQHQLLKYTLLILKTSIFLYYLNLKEREYHFNKNSHVSFENMTKLDF
jgi:hypothetical protein